MLRSYRWPISRLLGGRFWRWKSFSRWLSMAGLLALAFMAGGATVYFRWPSSGFLEKGFLGANAWCTRRVAISDSRLPSKFAAPAGKTVVDRPGETFDGFTLVACSNRSRPSEEAVLIDMEREVVHQWSCPLRSWWPNPPNLRELPPDAPTCFFGCYLYPHGDLLVTYHGPVLQTGCGLAKLDKDSNLLWAYRAHVHHDVDVAPDGAIYALVHDWVNQRPEGLKGIASPWLNDYLVVLSPDGAPRKEPIPLLEALQDSPFAALLSQLQFAGKPRTSVADMTAPRIGQNVTPTADPLHANFVRILPPALAAQFPCFTAGHVLVSLRNINVIAMLDPEARRIVWAARGAWQAQHDPQFLDNGHLLIFDNHGSPVGSRVLEWDPVSNGIAWFYPYPPNRWFFTNQRGMSQRLPNGNTLIVNSEGGELLEVAPNRSVVWSCFADGDVQTARRYRGDQVPFLPTQRARP